MAADHTLAIASLRRRLGACLSWADAHDKDALRAQEEANAARVRAREGRDEAAAIKLSIIELGGDPIPAELSHASETS